MSVAKKRDPGKWSRAKSMAKARMGGKHSARAMQLAVKIYKKMGGRYSGKKSGGNKLSKWSKQKWDYVSKKDRNKKGSKKSKGRYLPQSVRDRLSSKERAATNRKKRKANKSGKGSASYSKKIARMVRNA